MATTSELFALTQPGVLDSLAYHISQKQVYLSLLQAELARLQPSSSLTPPDPPQLPTVTSHLYFLP